ncbi:MAG TPA: alpha/beta hydrolase [Acidobacteriota bacterium]|nr:alpha/beta hydrolase [Acidobacteriota bacterium]
MRSRVGLLVAAGALHLSGSLLGAEIMDRVKFGFAENEGVRIHYAELGKGPLVVFIHGFPDFWYGWRRQMEALSDQYRVVAVDLRGYNLSDRPKGVENYAMRHLMADIAAVIRHAGEEKAVVVGHDWGGAVAWSLAMVQPELVERLVICNLPHPLGLMRELATNEQQRANSQYAREFQEEGAHLRLSAEELSAWVQDPNARPRFVEAFRRSDFEAMLNYYKANYPRPPYRMPKVDFPPVRIPTLVIHGLQDQYLLPGALNDTWKWVDAELTIVTIPDAGHFVQQDAAELVSSTIRRWLIRGSGSGGPTP